MELVQVLLVVDIQARELQVHHIRHPQLDRPAVIHSHHQLGLLREPHKYLLPVGHRIGTGYLVFPRLSVLMLVAHQGYRDNHPAQEL